MKPALFFIFLWISLSVSAQTPNWQNKDLQKDSVFGISTDKAYSSLLKHKKAKKMVLVAVIDGGVDTAHEDLKAVIWNNPGETPNGMDDDHNGYTDDLHGWDFIGGPGGDVQYETLELTRLIRKEHSVYDSLTDAELPGRYRKMKAEYDKQFSEAQKMVSGVGRFK